MSGTNAKRGRWQDDAFGSDEPLAAPPPASYSRSHEPEPKQQRSAQLTLADSASDEEKIQRNVCTEWALPEAGVWYLTGRQLTDDEPRNWLKDNPVIYGRKPIKGPRMPPELDARFEPDYVTQPDAETLVRLLEKVPRQEVFDGGNLEHPAPTPNVFGAMLSPHAPSRMAYAEDGRLDYTYGKPSGGRAYVTKPASWASKEGNEAELCTLLRKLAGELTTKLLSGSQRFNYVLVQRYAGRNTFLSFHRDAALKKGDTAAGQVHGTPVASISLGAERVFAFAMQPREHAKPMYGLRLPHRSLVTMSQLCNDTYAHALLLGSQNDEDGVRYNLTFRVMQPAAA